MSHILRGWLMTGCGRAGLRCVFYTQIDSSAGSSTTASASVSLRCDPARGNQTLYLLLQVSECWHLQGILGIWDSSYPPGRCSPSGHSPRYLTDPGPFYGGEEVVGGKKTENLSHGDSTWVTQGCLQGSLFVLSWKVIFLTT